MALCRPCYRLRACHTVCTNSGKRMMPALRRQHRRMKSVAPRCHALLHKLRQKPRQRGAGKKRIPQSPLRFQSRLLSEHRRSHPRRPSRKKSRFAFFHKGRSRLLFWPHSLLAHNHRRPGTPGLLLPPHDHNGSHDTPCFHSSPFKNNTPTTAENSKFLSTFFFV